MVDGDDRSAPLDPASGAGWVDAPPRMGFFTDTSVCIGCKACEVACKEWNGVPTSGLDLLGMSYDNTGALTANSWRHVAFIEQPRPTQEIEQPDTSTQFLGMPQSGPPGRTGTAEGRSDFRWLMMSDVCKHCTRAGCLDVCPTGALFRTEFGTVVVQEDICNGCGYCVSACPYGVIDRRVDDGRVWKCTLCYDRIGAGLTPACAQACPTESIQYGPLEELRERAAARVATLHERGCRRPGCTATTRPTGSGVTVPSSSCSTSRRCTVCRRIRRCPPGTCRRCGNGPGWPRWPWRPGRSWRSSEENGEQSASGDRGAVPPLPGP